MATQQNGSATESIAEAFAIGVCVPVKFPAGEIRTVLTQKGQGPVLWLESEQSAVEACRAQALDLLMLGVRQPRSEALDCVSGVRSASPTTGVILICERCGGGDVRKALDAGAHGLVQLSEVADALWPVVEVVRAGQVSVPRSSGREAGRKVLTSREKQILGQVVLGMSNAEIASQLFLAESTVKSHLSSAFAKLGVTSRNEAAALILDPLAGVGLGILTIPAEKVSASG